MASLTIRDFKAKKSQLRSLSTVKVVTQRKVTCAKLSSYLGLCHGERS